MTGIPLLIAFVIAIIIMIVAIAKWKIHPFLSIMGVSLILAIIAGIKLTDIPSVIGAGFSGTFSSIGIVIILGALVGIILEKTGAALKMADVVVKLVGKKPIVSGEEELNENPRARSAKLRVAEKLKEPVVRF